ncbi:MAG: tRNA-dihydrouridine synthase [Thermoleophilia bacterium]|nr:tRNA-dihydrouridine synthase [Thermoleophilia bacterium]
MTHTTSHTNELFSGDEPSGINGGSGAGLRPLGDGFNIGSLYVPNRLVQAPMAGISGSAFRLQARRFGAGLVTTEMISSYGIHYHNRRTQAMLKLTEEEHPVSVQIFGNDAGVMVEAALAAEAAGADVIDINMGCPVRKVVKTGAGVALMGDAELASRVTAAVSDAVSIPVTVKIRSGLKREITAPEFAKKLVQAGASAICIHPRLAIQGQKGWADHSVSAALAVSLGVPVIASGDVARPGQASSLIKNGCAAVMIGRASLGNPWIYRDLLDGVEPSRRPAGEVLSEMSCFYRDVVIEMGEERASRYMRKFYGWFLKTFRPDAGLRDGLRRAGSFADALELMRECFEN